MGNSWKHPLTRIMLWNLWDIWKNINHNDRHRLKYDTVIIPDLTCCFRWGYFLLFVCMH
jgi:hypothetical protein